MMRCLMLLSVVSVLIHPFDARAQSNLVLLASESGDYIGGGQTYATTNRSDISLSGTPALVSVDAFGFTFWIAGPGGADLQVSTYTNSARYPFNGSQPGFDVHGNGRGCNNDCGMFKILEIGTNADGQVDRFWATFSNRCECTFPPMTGEIRYNSRLAPAAPEPRILRVPADYQTIQAAIDAASVLATETVLVSDGTYFENLSFKGKAVTVTSVNGPGVTIIDGGQAGAVISFANGEGSGSTIRGFTIQHGAASFGAGIGLLAASPTIVGNIFRDNAQGGGGYGAGVGGNGASPMIEQNLFLNNSADDQFLSGVVSFVNGSSPLIANNIFVGNRCRAINLTLPTGSVPIVINNTIVSNTVGIRVDARVDTSAHAYSNNILIGNDVGLQVDFGSPANSPAWMRNLVAGGQMYTGIADQTGTNGNISLDPLFACSRSNDFHLLAGSPCIDAGTNGVPKLPDIDFDGNPRIRAGSTSATPIVDLGAYEFNPADPPVPCLYVDCPPNVTAVARVGQNSAVVTYPTPTGAPVAKITSIPPSGSEFPGGTNLVTVTASYGTNSVTCSFTVTVLVPPVITTQPTSLEVRAGQPINLNVGATGSTPLTYRWSFENTPIADATAATLTITNAQFANEGVYRAIVANSVGSATSSVAPVRVLTSAPMIVANPISAAVPASSNVTFAVVASGTEPLRFQWQFQGARIPSATNAQLHLNAVQASDSGKYQVTVSNSIGSVTSDPATLAVNPQVPYFVKQPVDTSVALGSQVTFAALAKGSEPITYQWQRDGTLLRGATTSSLTVTNAAFLDAGAYTLLASNIGGVSTSALAHLIVYQAPLLQQSLSNQVVDEGKDVLLSVSAIATPPPVFSWQYNELAIAGTNASLIVTNAQPAQSGYYRVTVTNQYGSASSMARISVLGPRCSVAAWGDNSAAQTSVPPGLNDAVAVAGGDYHSLALRRDGTLIAWGYNGDGQTNVPSHLQRFVSISSGANHNLAITEDGGLVAWGRNDSGQCNVPTAAASVLQTAAGETHSLALLSSGTIAAWGGNDFGQISPPSGLGLVRAIAAGRQHSLALRTNGTVIGWGFNAYGQASPPPSLVNVTAITAGYLHSVALLANGTLVAWGDNSFGQTNVPVGLTNVVAIAAGDFHTLALHADGAITAWGDGDLGQTTVPLLGAGAAGIAAGNFHSLALARLPVLDYALNLNALVLRWPALAVLQAAQTVNGPYTIVTGASQAYTNTGFSGPARFFRLQQR